MTKFIKVKEQYINLSLIESFEFRACKTILAITPISDDLGMMYFEFKQSEYNSFKNKLEAALLEGNNLLDFKL